MNPYTYKVSLRVFHPAMDPQLITDTLGMQPNKVQKVGNPRTTPTGTVLELCYSRSYWSFSFTTPDDSDVEEFLARTVEGLRQHRSFFWKILDTGGDVEFFIGLFADGVNIGTTLPHELLMILGDLGINLELDIYDYKTDKNQSTYRKLGNMPPAPE